MTSPKSGEPSLLEMANVILIEIFSYLLVKDRKNIRLTCRRFNETCNSFHIENTEVIALYGNADKLPASKIESLVNSTRKVWNIKFEGILLDTRILAFFGKHGAHIHSLAFHQCMPEQKVGLLRDIIQSCINLRSFSFMFLSHLDKNHPRRYNYEWSSRISNYKITDDLEALWSKKLIFNDVENLSLTLRHPSRLSLPYPITNEEFSHIFNIFPNVKNLDLCISVRQYFENNYRGPIPDLFSYSCLCDQLISLRHQLRKLNLVIIRRWVAPENRFWYDIHDIDSKWGKFCDIEMDNLKNLSVTLGVLGVRGKITAYSNAKSGSEKFSKIGEVMLIVFSIIIHPLGVCASYLWRYHMR